MKIYKKIGSKWFRLYGKNIKIMSKELNVSTLTLLSWQQKGLDIFLKAEQLNGFRGNRRLTSLWHNLKSRCNNPDDIKFKYYGGKGIKLKITKLDLVHLWNRDKAKLMRQPSIDRLDSNANYEFKNCRFIEMEENRRRLNK